MIFGWLQNRQSHWLLFAVVFWLFPSQKMGCSTQILFNHQISCFKAMPSFYGHKKQSPQMIIFWFFFSCISLNFWSTISHLSFFGIVAAQFFSDAVDLFS